MDGYPANKAPYSNIATMLPFGENQLPVLVCDFIQWHPETKSNNRTMYAFMAKPSSTVGDDGHSVEKMLYSYSECIGK